MQERRPDVARLLISYGANTNIKIIGADHANLLTQELRSPFADMLTCSLSTYSVFVMYESVVFFYLSLFAELCIDTTVAVFLAFYIHSETI
jgi:hypothetical protein